MRRILRRLNTGIEAALVVSVGLGCSQVSGFVEHYSRNLESRMAEARQEVSGIIERAGQAGMPAYAYLNQYVNASNPAFVHEGEAMQARIDHAGRLIDAYLALRHADILSRPMVFALYVDPAIAADVWHDYEPTLPADTASLLHAAIGMAAVLLMFELVRAAGGLMARLVRRRGAVMPVTAVRRR